MILTIALVVYAVGAVVFARMLAGHLAWKWKSSFVERPEALDWVGGWCFGILGCWLWLPFLASRVARRGLSRVPMPVIGAEREARERAQERRLEEAQQRIAELESEVGLK